MIVDPGVYGLKTVKLGNFLIATGTTTLNIQDIYIYIYIYI